jgi:excisionase family DNA binding protein
VSRATAARRVEAVDTNAAANDEVRAEPIDLATWAAAIARSLRAPTEREVMDADQVAAFLGVDRKTVYDYAGRGEIPHRRLGKRLLFSRSAIVAWLGACKAASKEG